MDAPDHSTDRIILASGSPRRRQLLAESGYDFEVVVPESWAECGICSSRGSAMLVAELALRKAASVRERIVHGTVVACDTVAECRGRVLGKPADRWHALDMLTELRGRRHRVVSGLCVWPAPVGSTAAGKIGAWPEPDVRVAVTMLRMDPINDAQLEDYLESGAWEGKAGAFGYQDRLGWVHIEKGSESNVVGLPMELLAEMLAGRRP